ncbi:MAG: hypothetical protein CMP24_03085 [Rickettsiales bacterium]|nr:hypothetical protein [Rickettsiales bacterium]
MQKILITGGSGTIGKILIPHLLGYGYDVDNYDLLKGDDVFNKDNLVSRCKNNDIIIHLAAIPHPCLKGVDDDHYWKINYEGTQAVFEAAKLTNIKKFIYLSSGCVYGFWGGHCKPDQFPIVESNYIPTIEEGLTVYGATKVASEEFLKKNAKKSNIKVISLRAEGPGAGGTRIEWINGLQNLNDKTWQATKPSFHFFARISIENLFQVFLLSIKRDLNSFYEEFNIGNEYIHWSIDVQKWIKLNFPNVKNFTKNNEALFGIDKAKKMLGYSPYPVDDHFPYREKIEDFYYKETYFGRIGKP